MPSQSHCRHDLYISKDVWGELKHRAFLEDTTAGAIIAYLLEWAIRTPEQIPPMGRYQARSPNNELDRTNRTVRGIPDDVWQRAVRVSRLDGQPISISGLVEHLLRNHLGLTEESPDEGERDSPPAQQDFTYGPVTTLRTGRVIFDLGDHPIEIDLNDLNAKNDSSA